MSVFLPVSFRGFLFLLLMDEIQSTMNVHAPLFEFVSFCDAAVIGYIMWFDFLVGFTGFRFEDRGASLQDGIT